MPKIEIVEYDLTTPGGAAESTDVVYIPGFVDVKANFDANTDGEYENALKINEPTLFTDVKQFESLCGTQPGVFSTSQYYRDLASLQPDGSFSGFSNNAIPYHGIMFSEGTADPSYIMAKELIAAGLPVLYQRVNPDEVITQITEQPSDWATNYSKYEIGNNAFTTISTSTPPEMMDVANGTKFSDETSYYIRSFEENKITYTKTTISEQDTYTIDEDRYIKDSNEASQLYYTKSDETYCFFNEVVFSITPVYEANKYYRATGSDPVEYELITDTTAPEDWGIGTYYSDSAGTPVVFTTSPEYQKDTYWKPDSAFGFVVITDDSAPSDWGSASAEYFSQDLVELEGSDIKYTVPDIWIQNYSTGYEGTIVYTQVESNQGAIPEFDSSTHKYRLVTSGIDIVTMYNALSTIYSTTGYGLDDKGNYSIKYLTSGGYPVYEYNNNSIVTQMINLAVNRGDCVAYIDHTDNPYRDDNIDHASSLYQTVVNDITFQNNGEFATMFTPWAEYNRITSDLDDNDQPVTGNSSIRMAASYAYFLCLADSIKTNANWLAIAGSARGVVPNLAQNGMTTNIPNGAADRMQPRDGYAVNAITNIRPYGYTIWGNRTLKNNGVQGNLTATSFLNIRNLVSDVKKEVYRTARKLTFEQNNDILWINFKAEITPLLDRMATGYGISGYKMLIDTENEHYGEKATLCVKIILYPVYPVEDFYVSIVLKDDEVSVAVEG